MKTRLVALSVVIIGASIFVAPVHAQRHGAAASRGSGARIRFVRMRNTGRFFASSAFAPYYYSDYDSEPDINDASQPPIIVVQSAQAASATTAADAPASLMLELQGDRWVRVINNGQSQTGGESEQPESERASNVRSAMPPATPRRNQAEEPPSELPRAVLVFRDGHKEEIGNYMIKGATIYTRADYWSSGSWTRQVQIVELDVPATLKLNQERGAKFHLPSGPNEVMIRP